MVANEKKLVAHYSTSGGKYSFKVWDNGDGTWDMEDYTNNRSTGMACSMPMIVQDKEGNDVNYKDHRISEKLYYAKKWDGINYKEVKK